MDNDGVLYIMPYSKNRDCQDRDEAIPHTAYQGHHEDENVILTLSISKGKNLPRGRPFTSFRVTKAIFGVMMLRRGYVYSA